MIENASVGDQLFFFGRIDMGVYKPESTTVISDEGNVIRENAIRKSQLNSLGRHKDRVWAESGLAAHEQNYMNKRSVRVSFL